MNIFFFHLTYRALLAVFSRIAASILFNALTFTADALAFARADFTSTYSTLELNLENRETIEKRVDVRGETQVSVVSAQEQSDPVQPGLQTHLPHSQVPWSGPAHGRPL